MMWLSFSVVLCFLIAGVEAGDTTGFMANNNNMDDVVRWRPPTRSGATSRASSAGSLTTHIGGKPALPDVPKIDQMLRRRPTYTAVPPNHRDLPASHDIFSRNGKFPPGIAALMPGGSALNFLDGKEGRRHQRPIREVQRARLQQQRNSSLPALIKNKDNVFGTDTPTNSEFSEDKNHVVFNVPDHFPDAPYSGDSTPTSASSGTTTNEWAPWENALSEKHVEQRFRKVKPKVQFVANKPRKNSAPNILSKRGVISHAYCDSDSDSDVDMTPFMEDKMNKPTYVRAQTPAAKLPPVFHDRKLSKSTSSPAIDFGAATSSDDHEDVRPSSSEVQQVEQMMVQRARPGAAVSLAPVRGSSGPSSSAQVVKQLPAQVVKRLPPQVVKQLPPQVVKQLPPQVVKRLPPQVVKQLPPAQVVQDEQPAPAQVPAKVNKPPLAQVPAQLKAEPVQQSPAQVAFPTVQYRNATPQNVTPRGSEAVVTSAPKWNGIIAGGSMLTDAVVDRLYNGLPQWRNLMEAWDSVNEYDNEFEYSFTMHQNAEAMERSLRFRFASQKEKREHPYASVYSEVNVKEVGLYDVGKGFKDFVEMSESAKLQELYKSALQNANTIAKDRSYIPVVKASAHEEKESYCLHNMFPGHSDAWTVLSNVSNAFISVLDVNKEGTGRKKFADAFSAILFEVANVANKGQLQQTSQKALPNVRNSELTYGSLQNFVDDMEMLEYQAVEKHRQIIADLGLKGVEGFDMYRNFIHTRTSFLQHEYLGTLHALTYVKQWCAAPVINGQVVKMTVVQYLELPERVTPDTDMSKARRVLKSCDFALGAEVYFVPPHAVMLKKHDLDDLVVHMVTPGGQQETTYKTQPSDAELEAFFGANSDWV